MYYVLVVRRGGGVVLGYVKNMVIVLTVWLRGRGAANRGDETLTRRGRPDVSGMGSSTCRERREVEVDRKSTNISAFTIDANHTIQTRDSTSMSYWVWWADQGRRHTPRRMQMQ